MSDRDCDCGVRAVEQENDQSTDTEGWVEERPVETARLPADVAENMSRFFGESVEVFHDLVSAIRNVVEGDGIAIDELCRVEGETPHYARTDDETYYFRCFYDGIALAQLVEEPVEIRTVTPANEPVEMEASPSSGIDVTPSGAVMSFGVATDREVPAGDGPTTQEIYGAICPYVRAFHTRDDYERWAKDVAATTVGIPLESGVPIAAALTADATTGVAE